MTIQSELERIGNNISSAYSALGENGATLPETQNSDNLAATVQTLPEKQDKITASGLLKGDGAGNISAAVAGTDYQTPLTAGTDYQTPLTAGTDYATPTQLAGKQDEITASGLLKGDGSGNVSAAVAGTDYQAPLTAGVDYLPMNGGTLTGQLQASSTAMAALAVQQVRNIYFGTAEMEDGVSDLPAGVLYFQYDAGV